MALEIERRFLVRGEGWRIHSRWQRQLQQGYLISDSDGMVLRVRTSRLLGQGAAPAAAGGAQEPGPAALPEAWLTLKLPAPQAAASAALTRQEFEYAIPAADAASLLAQSGAVLTKRRHGLDLPGGNWVLDVFEAANAPLVVAEVELEHADQPVLPPSWCVRELTGRHDLSNAALARHPLAAWDAGARAALLADAGL